jgi:hypothetical protein
MTRTPPPTQRPRMPKVDPETQRWCALLQDEVSAWRKIRTKPMFGMLALYRGDRIFAALPLTRAPRTPNSLLVKLPGVRDARLTAAQGPGKAWASFEMTSATDIPEALRWLQRAYMNAGAR